MEVEPFKWDLQEMGTLTINFNDSSDSNTFTLDLSNTNSSLNYSFVGNITTSYGDTKGYNRNRKFVGIFGRSVKEYYPQWRWKSSIINYRRRNLCTTWRGKIILSLKVPMELLEMAQRL